MDAEEVRRRSRTVAQQVATARSLATQARGVLAEADQRLRRSGRTASRAPGARATTGATGGEPQT
jgi:hypothetical protein